MGLNELRQHAATFRDVGEQIETLEEAREVHARPIEAAAHVILKARHYYRRAGSWPSLREVNDEEAYFHVSNGYDTHDDMGATLKWSELEDPATAAEAAAREREERERRSAAADLRAARERARKLGVES